MSRDTVRIRLNEQEIVAVVSAIDFTLDRDSIDATDGHALRARFSQLLSRLYWETADEVAP